MKVVIQRVANAQVEVDKKISLVTIKATRDLFYLFNIA